MIDAGLSYLEAKVGPLSGSLPLAFDRLKIPVRDGKGTRLAPLAELSQKAIQAATRTLLKKKSVSPKSPTRDALEDALGEHSVFARVVVHHRAGLATFANVPIASLALFGRTLAAAKVPVPAAAPGKKAKRGKG